MMRITFTFDGAALLRPRYIQLKTVNDPTRYQISSDPIYNPLHRFIANYKPQGYIFNMMELLHSTGLKMLSRPGMSSIRMLRRTFLVTGGLYLALDLKHPDLAIRESFGDFTSGFSHQFGVGLSALSMSQAFDICWDKMQAIDVNGKKVLDFFATIPGGELLVEAKGVTSWSSRYTARSSIYDKKKVERQSVPANIPGASGAQKAMIGIIIHALNSEKASVGSRAARGRREPTRAEMEIIDPDFGVDLVFSESAQKAGRYWHYAGAATFAGLYDIAEELMRRADALVKGIHHSPTLRLRDFDRREVLQTRSGRNVVGIQWQPSDRAENVDDVWFYQALDKNVIRDLIENDVFPNTEPYHYDRLRLSTNEYVENTFPDGSYFGIGSMQRGGLRVLKLGDIGKRGLQY